MKDHTAWASAQSQASSFAGSSSCCRGCLDDAVSSSSSSSSSTRQRRIKLKRATTRIHGSSQEIIKWLQNKVATLSCSTWSETALCGCGIVVDLSDCFLKHDTTRDILQFLLDDEIMREHISELDLSGNRLGGGGGGGVHVATLLSALLIQGPRLQCLRLDRNEVDANFIQAMMTTHSSNALAPEKCLDLYLFGNKLGNQGIRILAQSPWCGHFRVLHLGSNGLRQEALPWLTRLLLGMENDRSNHNLQELDLFANLALFQDSRHYIKAFGRALQSSSLQRLRICMCPLADRVTAATVLHHLPVSLKRLQAVNCQLTSIALLCQLALQLQNLPMLTHLVVDGWMTIQAPWVEDVWRTALLAHPVLNEIQMSQFAARSTWRTFSNQICQRNRFIASVQTSLAVRNDTNLALATPLIAQLGKSALGLSALYLFVRQSPGLIA